MLLDLLLTACIAHTTVIPDTAPILKNHGVTEWAYTNSNGIFIAKSHENDVNLTTHECGHYIDFVLVQGKAKTENSKFSTDFLRVKTDDPSIGYYKINWTDFATAKKNAVFSETYAGTSPYEEFAVGFTNYVFNNKLDSAHNRQMRIMLSKASISLRTK